MRLNELHEFDFPPVKLDQFIEDCRPWLNAIKGSRLPAYHGSYSFSAMPRSYVMDMKARTKPRDTPEDVHAAVNDIFEKKFGWKARNGMFVTGDSKTAKIYGDLFVIFPIGGFQTLWTSEIEDLLHTFNLYQTEARITHGLDPFRDKDAINKYASEGLNKEIEAAHWEHNTNVGKALTTRHEIMLECKSFYYFANANYHENIRPALITEGYIAPN